MIAVRPPIAVERVPIDSVAPHPRNPREGDVGAISVSLAMDEGQYRPIVVQRATPDGEERNVILAGNHTWMAAKALGWSDIDIVPIVIADDRAAALMLRDNRTHDLGRNDDLGLFALLRELDVTGVLGYTAYERDDLDELLRDLERDGQDPMGRLGRSGEADASSQPRSDRRALVTCPACGDIFDPREG